MAASGISGICDLSRMYTDDYQYSLPQPVLKTFLSGDSFDHKKAYTREEAARVNADIEALWTKIIADAKPLPKGHKDLVATISAGAPGAGKTTVMNKIKEGQHVPYVCPDDVCLKGQTQTYLADIERGMNKDAAYTKWRPASNAANHILLGNLIKGNEKGRYPFFFGTTSQSPFTFKFYEHLKEHGYKIHIIHVSAPDEVRDKSIQQRDKTFVQTTPEDVRDKGLEVTKRVQDTFLKYADTMDLYYRDQVSGDAVLAANWSRVQVSPSLKGRLEIIDPKAYECVKIIHNQATETLRTKGEEAQTWEEAFESTLVQ